MKNCSWNRQTKIETILINIQSFDISMIIRKEFKHDDAKMLAVAVLLATQNEFVKQNISWSQIFNFSLHVFIEK